MSTSKGKRRSRTSGATQDHHAPSSDMTTPPVSSLNVNRQAIPGPSSKFTTATPLDPTEVEFNPKSILPDYKPQKSISKLLETSVFPSKHIPSQGCTFSCIDGSVRTFDAQTSSYHILHEENYTVSKRNQTNVSVELSPSTSQQTVSQGEQFRAFGIEAFPTKAIFNELCFDFVSYKRWCPHGSHCYRIHPLHRSSYLPTVVKESHLYSRMRRQDRHRSIVDQTTNEDESIQKISTSSSQDAQHTRNPSRNAGSSGASQTLRAQSKARSNQVHWSAEDIRTPPWADHPPSDTSSSSNGSDDGEARLWEPHTDLEDWLGADTVWHTTFSTLNPSSSSSNPQVVSSSVHTHQHSKSSASSIVDSPQSLQPPRQIHPLPSGPNVQEPGCSSSVKRYRPIHGKRCHRWLRNECQLGLDCRYIHDDLEYDSAEPPRVATQAHVPQAPATPAAQLPERAAQISQEPVSQVPKIPEVVRTPQTPQGLEPAPIIKVKHPRPRTTELCRQWQQKACSLGYDCRWIHSDLEYDDDESQVKKPPEVFGFTLHDHMRIRVGAGFEIKDVTTGFESRWVNVGNLPYQLPDKQLAELMREFGEVLDIRRGMPSSNARVQFSKPAEAYKAFITLHGGVHFGRKLELRMAVETKIGGSSINATMVRIDWEAPQRNVYMGYESMDAANAIVAKARYIPYEDYMPQANVHIGVPAVGMVTVKFAGVPVNVTEEKMEEFYGPHQGMVTERPNYKDFTADDTIKGVRKLLNQPQFRGKVVNLEFRAPPYRDGKMRAWAHFNTPSDAKFAAENLHGRKPIFTGHTRISARHIKTINYYVHNDRFRRLASEVRALSDTIRKEGGGYALSVKDDTSPVTLGLSGEDLQVLRRWKVEVERTLNGELILKNGVSAWDDFFGGPSGLSFLQDVERSILGVRLERDSLRRTIRAFGIADVRLLAKEKILHKIGVLKTQKSYMILMDGRLTYAFSSDGYDQLQAQLGVENLVLDVWNRSLRIRGDENAFDIAKDAVTAARLRLQISDCGKASVSTSVQTCPVCFNEPSNPVRLTCGHAWCRGCIHRYFTASIDQKFFPLTCLGNEGKCQERIPLLTARTVLSAGELDSVVKAAFTAYVQANAKDYHYCPTPDCSQVYRSAPEGVFIQCPSCLVRTCPNCHKDAHDGQTCLEVKSGDELFKLWASKHDVKQCPQCSVAIEKDEGCNHMMCTMCKTHVCWVCMTTFPNGDGIYGHMQSEHGDWGLGPILP